MIAGIDIGGTAIKFGIVDQEENLLWNTSVPSILRDPDAMVEQIAGLLQQAPYPVEKIGVGITGRVNPYEDWVSTSNLQWPLTPFCGMLKKRFGLPTWVDNDAQAAMASEWKNGALKDVHDGLYITLGTGIGGAMLLGGKPWRGFDNSAGELGHIITHKDGRECACGFHGCFEAYASASALSRMAGGKSAREVWDMAKANDPWACEIIDQYIDELVCGLTGLTMVFAPEVIVLGGGMSAAGEFLREKVDHKMSGLFEERRGKRFVEIRLAKHRNDAGMIGAAALARWRLGGEA